MAVKKKKRPANRKQRLTLASTWIPTYTGKHIVNGYRRMFGVSRLCASIELRTLGVDIPNEKVEEARMAERRLALARARRRTSEVDSGLEEEHFAFIAGYTSGGFPYGTTWDQLTDNGDFAVEWSENVDCGEHLPN